MTGMPFTGQMMRSSVNAKAPQRMNQPPILTEPPQEFFYDYNFDENGVLYYLGTFGKRRMWQNPHTTSQVQAFASSISPKCSIDSFVGRGPVQNCRTEDQEYSFFGVDLGLERRLVPTYYTLRNRNSTSHVLQNWYFEGSATGQSWTILDARIYKSESMDQNEALSPEHNEFRKIGGSLTFQIDKAIYQNLGYDGYRFFRIV